MKFAYKGWAVFFALECALLAWAYADCFYGPTGLFWYHREIEYGPMLADLGDCYTLIVFGKRFRWMKPR